MTKTGLYLTVLPQENRARSKNVNNCNETYQKQAIISLYMFYNICRLRTYRRKCLCVKNYKTT